MEGKDGRESLSNKSLFWALEFARFLETIYPYFYEVSKGAARLTEFILKEVLKESLKERYQKSQNFLHFNFDKD